MKIILLMAGCLSFLGFPASSQGFPIEEQRITTDTEWRDLQDNEVNRFKLHTNCFAYESVEKALFGDRKASENYLSLNGTWKFHYAETPDDRLKDFYLSNHDDSSWKSMPVPGLWELNGYGDPVYVNVALLGVDISRTIHLWFLLKTTMWVAIAALSIFPTIGWTTGNCPFRKCYLQHLFVCQWQIRWLCRRFKGGCRV